MVRLKHAITIPIITFVIMLAGCAQKPPLVGTWFGTDTLIRSEESIANCLETGELAGWDEEFCNSPLEIPITLQLNEDGTYRVEFNKGYLYASTYVYEKDMLTLHDYIFDGENGSFQVEFPNKNTLRMTHVIDVDHPDENVVNLKRAGVQ